MLTFELIMNPCALMQGKEPLPSTAWTRLLRNQLSPLILAHKIAISNFFLGGGTTEQGERRARRSHELALIPGLPKPQETSIPTPPSPNYGPPEVSFTPLLRAILPPPRVPPQEEYFPSCFEKSFFSYVRLSPCSYPLLLPRISYWSTPPPPPRGCYDFKNVLPRRL